MSPEQCRGLATDQRSDIYSFGCLMYETLSGAPPFPCENPIDTIKKQVSELPPPMKCSQLTPSLRDGLEAIVLKAMAKDREARYQNIGALREDLRKLTESPQSDFLTRLKTIWNINSLRLSGAAEDQTLMLKTAVLVLAVIVVLSCIAGIGFCVYWSMAHPESKI
jgi:serine/threonine protein kinase